MKVFIDKQLKSHPPEGPFRGPAAIFADSDERDAALSLAGINWMPIFPEAERKSIRFESRNQYDYITLHIPDFIYTDKEPVLFEIFLTREFLVVFGENHVLTRWQEDLIIDASQNTSAGQMLSLLFNRILSQHFELLERIEDQIEKLEEGATLKKPEDHTAAIISLRKQLLALKRYFEAIYGVMEELEENRNGLFSQNRLQVFRAQKNKAGRLLSTVMNLRDYLTQVREAYQNQLDISLNSTMRFFTVITSIFLPPSLIVGWYGMNLKMPELSYEGTYGIVILISLVFVVSSLIYCRKKGWF